MINGGNFMKASRNNSQIFLIFIIFFVLSNYLWLYVWQNNNLLKITGQEVFSLSGAVIATVCIWHVFRKTEEDEARFWLIIFLGCICNVLALFITNYYEIILEVETPFPGLPDVFYLLQFSLFLFSILYLVYLKKYFLISFRLFCNILITMTVMVTFSWGIFMQPIFLLKDTSFLSKAVSVAYTLADLAILFGILSLTTVSDIRFFKGYSSLVIKFGLLTSVIADSLFMYFSAKNLYSSGSLIDPLWTLAMLSVGLSGLMNINPSESPPKKVLQSEEIPQSTAKLLNLIIPYFSLLALLTVMMIKTGKINSVFLGSLIAIILLIIRQILTIIENNRLVLSLLQVNHELAISKNALEEKHKSLTIKSASIQKEAQTDFLTGLYNRRYIEKRLNIFWELAKHNNKYFSAIMLDIDHFKQINDNYGHEAGDIVLKQISQIILKNTRSQEIIGRFGGEEFFGFLPEVSIDEAKMIAERLRKQIEEHIFIVNTDNLKVTVSIGVSQWTPRKNDDVQSLILRTDKAL
jgi:diguanylate cyclase (GGDEF)-like protein